jgi:hypothetical protein
MFKFLFALIVLGLDIWAILNIFRNGRSDGMKVGWLLVILFFPVVGFIAWYVLGPKDNKRLPGR